MSQQGIYAEGKMVYEQFTGFARIRCNHCNRLARPSQYYRQKGLIRRTCKRCVSTNRREYYGRTGQKKNAQAKEHRRQMRRKLIVSLGGQCACCGESHFSMLDIDHVKGNGRAHRESLGYQWHKLFRHVSDNVSNGLYQLLCSNCNQSKRRLGECEHAWHKVESTQKIS